MKKLLVGFFSIFLLTAAVKPQKAEAGIIVLVSGGTAAPLMISGLVTAVFAQFTEDERLRKLSYVFILADESEDAIRNQMMAEFPSITNEALDFAAQVISEKAKNTLSSEQGVKEVVLDKEVAQTLTELADFQSVEESNKFYKTLTTKSLTEY